MVSILSASIVKWHDKDWVPWHLLMIGVATCEALSELWREAARMCGSALDWSTDNLMSLVRVGLRVLRKEGRHGISQMALGQLP